MSPDHSKLERLCVAVTSNDTDNFHGTFGVSKENHVTAQIRTPDFFAEFSAIIANAGMACYQTTLLFDFGHPLPRRDWLVLGDVPCDLFQVLF
jgi:hypothetical protein